jgi:hypothetical protein
MAPTTWQHFSTPLEVSVTLRFFQSAFRWNIKLFYIQHPNTEQITNGAYFSCFVPPDAKSGRTKN